MARDFAAAAAFSRCNSVRHKEFLKMSSLPFGAAGWQWEEPGGPRGGGALGVVTRRHQQVGEHQQLVVGEALPVLLPVVVVGAPELGQRLFHRHLE